MGMKYMLAALIAILLLGGPVFSQTLAPAGGQNKDRARTIEDLYLSQNVELQILRNQALSNDGDIKLLALQSVRSMVKDGKISEDNPGAFAIVEYLAVPERGPTVGNFPMVRREACSILGEVKSDRSKRILLEVLKSDAEPMVLAEAVYSLGQIGLNKDGEVTEGVMWALHRENVKATPDNNFAFAAILAIERISKSESGIKKPELLGALIEILESNYIKDVKLKAIDVIYKMRQAS